MTDPVLRLERVTKRFAGHVAVNGLSLDVASGAIYGLLGPNGAGKTTTLRMVMNILAPDEGAVRLFGDGASGRDRSARIGYLPEERGLYPRMRVLDVLLFLAETKGVPRRVARPAADEWLDRLGLAAWRSRRVSELSKGMQQKVQFIATLLHDPDLVILDEPFAGLDPVTSQVMRDVVLDLRARGKTLVFSTHIMEHAEQLCDQVCILARGQKVVDGPLSQVKRAHGGTHLVVAFDGDRGGADRVFADPRLVAGSHDSGQYAELELTPGADAQAILRALIESGARLSRFELVTPSLHAIFVDLVGPPRPSPGAARVEALKEARGG